MLKLYNTLTRKKEVFKPIGKEIGMYSCGPTVYDFAHIGNFRAYICSDILKRYLKFSGYKVEHVMNLTDVDDKTIKRSQEQGIKLKELTEKYSKAFFEDLKTLNIEYADIFPKATDHIKEMIKLIQTLIDKGYAYLGKDGSIYYKISKFEDYGKLSKIKVKELKEGASERIKKDEYDKDNARDFALWKSWIKEDGKVFWNAEFTIQGKKQIVKGRPGWHIECSAMSSKYLGESFDIHSGGQDLIFPHHENEIAQSEAATGKQFVKYWIHNGWLLVEGKKMSKSLGNFYALRDLINKGYSARAIRLILMLLHYREPLDFTMNKLDAAEQTIKRIDNFLERLESDYGNAEISTTDKLIQNLDNDIKASLDNDLDIAGALEFIFNFIRDVNTLIDNGEISKDQAKKIIKFMEKIDKVFGIFKQEKIEIPCEIKKLADEREKARKAKDWKKADELRDMIKEKGFFINDTPEGYRITKL